MHGHHLWRAFTRQPDLAILPPIRVGKIPCTVLKPRNRAVKVVNKTPDAIDPLWFHVKLKATSVMTNTERIWRKKSLL